MTSDDNTTSTPDAALATAPTAGEVDSTKRSLPLDVRSNLSDPSSKDLKTTLVDVTINNPIYDATNTSVEPTEVFKITVSNIYEAVPFIIALIYYETETVILQLEDLNQELINYAATYKADAPNPKNPLSDHN